MITDWGYLLFKDPNGFLQRAKRKIPPKRWIGFLVVGRVMASFPVSIMAMAPPSVFIAILGSFTIVLAGLFLPFYGLWTLLKNIEDEEKQIGRKITLEDWKRK
jgi:hypothetical protein